MQENSNQEPIPSPAELLAKQLTGKPPKAPHVEELCEALIAEFGGVFGYAREFKSVYDDAPKASKIILMRSLARMLEVNTQLGGATEDVTAMEEEDLKRILKGLLPSEPPPRTDDDDDE